MQLKPIRDQVVVLARASNGIGRETALRFAKKGTKVVVSARNEEGLNSLVKEIRNEGGEAVAMPADVTKITHMKAIAERAAAEYGRLDTPNTSQHLVGIGLYTTFEQTTPKEFKQVVDVDLMG